MPILAFTCANILIICLDFCFVFFNPIHTSYRTRHAEPEVKHFTSLLEHGDPKNRGQCLLGLALNPKTKRYLRPETNITT